MSFAGEIKTMPLPDLLQWVELNQKSGILELRSGAAARRFSFVEGLLAQVTSSEHPDAASASDVQQILANTVHWTKGRFQFVEQPMEPGPSLGLSSKRLLLDAFRELDEIRRDGHEPDGAGRVSNVEQLRFTIIDRLLRNDIQVPLLPSVVGKILEITRQPDFSLRDLSDVIVTDQVITAHLLRNANSAYYGSRQEIETSHQAVQLLGSQAVTNIVLALSLRSMGGGGSEFDPLRRALWKRSVFCAVVARSLAKSKKLDGDLVFLCGLLMDFGKIVLLAITEEIIEDHPEYYELPSSEIEGILEAFHLHAGSIVAEKWTLPAAVRESMTSHEAPDAAPEELRSAIASASVGDFLARHFTKQLPAVSNGDTSEVAREMAELEAADILGLSAAECARLVALGPKFEAFAADLLD